MYEGFWYDSVFGVGVLWAHENFRARSDDILLATFPKCGTTWLKALMFAIKNRNDHCKYSINPLLTTNPHNCVPYIELQVHENNPTAYLDSLPSPRLLSTHSSYNSLPKSSIKAGIKVVSISRGPKDVFVSWWMFCNNLRAQQYSLPPLSIEDAFESFYEGVCLSGPYWDFVLGYWKASLDCPDTVLFLKYEDMKRDTIHNVKKLAEFMGYPFTLEEEKRGAVKDIIKLCSIENLSNLEVNKSGVYNVGSQTRTNVPNNVFFRRGEVGDSENHLTPEMIERFDHIMKQKLKGSGLDFSCNH
ncbi:Sulfotransfer_1 domain-containing protein [Cephalotus follicularis]|uniref:Sulfotransferase n=1 Tax=Cephalotus follicularis TaxID=3775 RepID=A0A1Q3B1P8_CEPFO|nr:Sulfotransfer_1 domain-containing protein [Cephalotus follicularis]